MTTPPAFTEIAETLAFLEDWEERYGYIIELGRDLPRLEEAERIDANKVRGCASQVWLVTEHLDTPGGPVLRIRGESDALIVQGLVAVLIALYSMRPATEIAKTDALARFDELGLREHLTSQRANGLASMVARVRAEAQAIAAV